MSSIPANNEMEISLFGPGYGECIVVHIGNNKWVIIDSCLEPTNRQPAAIKYLLDLGVDLENSVQLIIATHWHDDHIRGLAETLKVCRNAAFVCSGALKCEEFLVLTQAYSARSSLSKGLNEFNEIISILDERGLPPKFAIAERCLSRFYYDSKSEESLSEIHSLTPSDESIRKAQFEIAQLLPNENESKKDLLSSNANHASVVTWLKIAKIIILLGADLYNTSSQNTGWNAVLNSTTRPQGMANIYKIAHHGSSKSDNAGIWNKLLIKNPFAIVTPFTKGNVELPDPNDIKRICNYTRNAYITSYHHHAKIKRDKVVEQFIKGATKSIRLLNKPFGQIRVRAIFDQLENLDVYLSGSATQLRP